MKDLIDDYSRVEDCCYKGEHYSVRDNGAVYRHSIEGKRPRKLDEKWTFGIKNDKTGYMMISSHRVHIIVATAFLGKHDSKVYVVDHKDTNRGNNRIENLNWLTRLENALCNPITVERIIYHCGSIENFLKNPSLLCRSVKDKDISWMGTVSSEEAARAYRKVLQMQWYKKVVRAKYPNEALQLYWNTPSEFVSCPTEITSNPIEEYYAKLNIGSVYNKTFFNLNSSPTAYTIVDKAIVEDGKAILVSCFNNDEDPVKPYALSRIWFSGGQFIHENIGSFFEEKGCRKQFVKFQGLIWTGGDSIDDYC